MVVVGGWGQGVNNKTNTQRSAVNLPPVVHTRRARARVGGGERRKRDGRKMYARAAAERSTRSRTTRVLKTNE